MNQKPLERVWKSFAQANHFLHHEFVDQLQRTVVLNPNEWSPFFDTWKVLNEERPFIPERIYNKGASILTESLQTELNKLIELLRELLSVRKQGVHDEPVLDRVRKQIKMAWDVFERELVVLNEQIQASIREEVAVSKGQSPMTIFNTTIGAISQVSGSLVIGQAGNVTINQSSIDRSIHIANSFNELKEQIDVIKLVENALAGAMENSNPTGEVLVQAKKAQRTLRSAREELEDEEKPDPKRLLTLLEQAKYALKSFGLTKEIIEAGQKLEETFHLSDWLGSLL